MSWSALSAASTVSCTSRRVSRRHRGLAQLQRVHLAEALEARHRRLRARVLGADALEDAVALGVVERVLDVLAVVDAVERRHRDVDVTREHQRAEVPQEQRAEQRRDVQAVGVGVRQDADLVVAQVRRSSSEPGSTPIATVMSWTSCDDSIVGRLDFPGVQDLAAQRHHRLEFAVARLLGGAAGRVAFDQEQLGALRVLAGAVGELARQRRARSRRACARSSGSPCSRVCALTIASCAIFSPASGCWLSHSPNWSLTMPETNAAGSRDDSRSLVWPGELRVAHLHRQHVAGVVPDVLGRRA